MAREPSGCDDGMTRTNPETATPLTLDNVTLSVPGLSNVPEDDADTHVLTILGQGEPASFEVAASDSIALMNRNPAEEAITVAHNVAEGTLDTGFMQFRVCGDLEDVRFLSGSGIAYLDNERLDL